MSETHSPPETTCERMEMSAAIVTANGYPVTEASLRHLRPLLEGELTTEEMEADLLARLERLNHGE